MSRDRVLPIGQMPMVVNLTQGIKSGTVYYIRTQLILRLRIALQDETGLAQLAENQPTD